MKKKKFSIKIRRTWKINPKTKVKPAKEPYSRKREKQEIKKTIEEQMTKSEIRNKPK